MDNNQVAATRMAARVDSAEFGMDPATIAIIIANVLPLVLQCFARNDVGSPEFIRAEVERLERTQPESLRRRLARRIRGEADQPMTKRQSFLLAEAVIQETLASDDEVVYGVAVACGCQPGGEV